MWRVPLFITGLILIFVAAGGLGDMTGHSGVGFAYFEAGVIGAGFIGASRP